ncbi:cytochrome c oxidase subunit 5A, mitochondrial-like [Rhagoletis pomonella]|uniref:cytochrome c oxidase subunit 5A, mitochondrial-like n=1 Tax=Rhagoletis pomonella TaxID=28610 RepID=UPI00177ACD0A|nr:cytochrome c oxidase subunit 5A, mitochondrial-like [Rhagoletis pomonella]
MYLYRCFLRQSNITKKKLNLKIYCRLLKRRRNLNMLRTLAAGLAKTARSSRRLITLGSTRNCMYVHEEEPEQVFNKRFEDFFNRCEIDGWDLRQGMNDILGYDVVPHPKIIEAGLRACRRVNDIALAIRWLEACKNRCGDKVDQIYPYLLNNIRPTLYDLGIPTPEELNYDKPELAVKSVFDM